MGSKRTEWCKHYNGLSNGLKPNDCCKAGVRYDSVAVVHEQPKGRSLPCVPEFNRDGEAKCAKYELRTAEEIAAYEESIRARFASTGIARLAIVDHLGGQWKKGTPGASGRIDCPVCNAKQALAFSRAGYNGHIHAQCSTPKCVSWME